MTPAGLIIPMHSEAFALLGRRDWHSSDGFLFRYLRSDSGITAICICSGAGPENAAMGADLLIAAGVGLLVVAGTAGGMHPALRPGDLIAADRIFEENRGSVSLAGRTTGTQYWKLLKSTTEKRIVRGAVVTCRMVIETPEEKKRLYRQTGALAVDMESAPIVRAAARRGLPCVVLRAVCDTATENVPREILDTIDMQGRLHADQLARILLRRPALLPALLRLNTEFRAAMRALRKALPLIL
jgi:adenosylhomocysteine nucleosidase